MSKVSATKPLKVLIVTCRKSPPERIATARRALKALGIPLDIEIINGFVSEDAQIDQLYDAPRNRRWMKRPLSRSEIAVYASHRAAWAHLINSGHPAALIFEDDFAILNQEVVTQVITDWRAILGTQRDIVKLFDFEKRRPNRPVFETNIGGIDLVKWAAPTAGMVGYLISTEGAEKFLSRKRIYRQVDEDTKYFWEFGLNIWSLRDNPIDEQSPTLGGSLVEQSRQELRGRSLGRAIWGNLLVMGRKGRTKAIFWLEKQKRPRA
ncbi:MAG: glycosyltransferase family 25 protein [Paracoccaceae bacterium]